MKYVIATGTVAILLLTAVATRAQELRQTWELRKSGTAGKVHFRVERKKAGSTWNNSYDVPLDRFRGLPAGDPFRSGPAKFEYVQDAGRLLCEGSFSGGSGDGTFTFAPNADYSRQLEALGYEAPTEEQQFSMMMVDVTLEFARTVKSTGLDATTKQLIEMRIHGVSSDFIREARQAGYTNFTAKDYVELKIHGTSVTFMKDLKQAGYDLTAREIVELRIHGTTSEYMQDLKKYGLRPTPKEIVELRIHGVTPEYLNGLKTAGFGTLASREITELKIHGVSTQFIQDTKDLGYSFTPKELTEMKIHGVNGEYLRKLKASGMKNLTAKDIVKLRIHGVD